VIANRFQMPQTQKVLNGEKREKRIAKIRHEDKRYLQTFRAAAEHGQRTCAGQPSEPSHA